MKRFIVLFCIIFNLCFGYKMDIKINKLKEEKQLKIEKEIAYIQKQEWLVLSREEKIQLLVTLNKQSRGKEEKNVIIIKDIEAGEELAKIGIFGIEIKEESGWNSHFFYLKFKEKGLLPFYSSNGYTPYINKEKGMNTRYTSIEIYDYATDERNYIKIFNVQDKKEFLVLNHN